MQHQTRNRWLPCDVVRQLLVAGRLPSYPDSIGANRRPLRRESLPVYRPKPEFASAFWAPTFATCATRWGCFALLQSVLRHQLLQHLTGNVGHRGGAALVATSFLHQRRDIRSFKVVARVAARDPQRRQCSSSG